MTFRDLPFDKIGEYIKSVAPNLLIILLIIVGSWLTWWILRAVSHRITNQITKRNADRDAAQRVETVSGILDNLISISIGVLAVTLVLGELGVNLGPLIAAAGIAGVAIGFGAQSVVKDALTGFFFLLEGQVRVGDVVEAAGKVGLVESITMRVLVLRDFAGIVHVIPHGEVSTISNMSKNFSMAVIEVGVAYREDTEEVMRLLREEADALCEDPEWGPKVQAEPEVFGIDEFGDSALLFKVRFKVEASSQWNVARAYRRRVKSRFDKENIEIPFPHQTLYFGEDKEGKAPPMFVHLNKDGETVKTETA